MTGAGPAVAGDPVRFFRIGFQKCGTSAITAFLNRSGIPCIHYDRGRLARRMRENLAQGRRPLEGYERYRAFANMDWAGMDRAGGADFFDGFACQMAHQAGFPHFDRHRSHVRRPRNRVRPVETLEGTESTGREIDRRHRVAVRAGGLEGDDVHHAAVGLHVSGKDGTL